MPRRSLARLYKDEFTGYSLAKFQQDLLAGLTVAAVALPLALAFGIASGASAAAGLITAILAGFIMGALTGAPFQIIYAGKAHPNDSEGKEFIQRIVQVRDALKPAIPIVYLENYDMEMAKLLTAGVDVVTSGDHVWDQKEFVADILREPRILRPANYPAGQVTNVTHEFWIAELIREKLFRLTGDELLHANNVLVLDLPLQLHLIGFQ